MEELLLKTNALTVSLPKVSVAFIWLIGRIRYPIKQITNFNLFNSVNLLNTKD